MKCYYLLILTVLLSISTCKHDDDEPSTLSGSLYFASSKLNTVTLGYQFLKRTIYLRTSTDVRTAYVLHTHNKSKEKEIRDIGKLFYESEAPLLWIPLMYAAAIIPVRKGSSEKYSKLRPQRGFL